MKGKINIGDKVAYNVSFLKSCGMTTGEIPRARGIVTDIHIFGGDRHLVTSEWGNPDIPKKVLSSNLTLVSRIGIDSALNT